MNGSVRVARCSTAQRSTLPFESCAYTSSAPSPPLHPPPFPTLPTGLLAACASAALCTTALLAERSGRGLVLAGRDLLRWPLALVAASELVKLRFVVTQELLQPGLAPAGPGGGGGGGGGSAAAGRDWYFLALYCTYVVAQVCCCYLKNVLLFKEIQHFIFFGGAGWSALHDG